MSSPSVSSRKRSAASTTLGVEFIHLDFGLGIGPVLIVTKLDQLDT